MRAKNRISQFSSKQRGMQSKWIESLFWKQYFKLLTPPIDPQVTLNGHILAAHIHRSNLFRFYCELYKTAQSTQKIISTKNWHFHMDLVDTSLERIPFDNYSKFHVNARCDLSNKIMKTHYVFGYNINKLFIPLTNQFSWKMCMKCTILQRKLYTATKYSIESHSPSNNHNQLSIFTAQMKRHKLTILANRLIYDCLPHFWGNSNCD